MAATSVAAGCKYPVFISYSHRDERWASWLHKGIESYRVPKPIVGQPGRNGLIPAKISPVFRDRDELAASADLPGTLREALAQSAYLIVVCSPAAAQSRWVNEEITEFKRLGRADRILPLIVDGEPHAATAERECFPPALRFQLDADGHRTDQPAEPIAADLRPEADGKDNAKLKLIAGVLGVPFNALRQRELIAARRRARMWQGIGAAMLLLAVLAAAGGWMAWRYAKYSEGLLAQAINISTDQVSGAVRVADQQGVSRDAIDDLLRRAKRAYDGLVDETAQAPWLPWRAQAPWRPWHEPAPPARLRGQQAVLLLVRADHEGKVGDIEQQRHTAEQARSELDRVSKEEPSDPEWRAHLALSNDLIADADANNSRVDDALAGYRAARAIHEGLGAGDPGNSGWQRAIARSNINVGDMLARQAHWGPALDAFRAAVAIEERLIAATPSDLEAQRGLLIDKQRVGDILLKQRNGTAAETLYSEALATAERLAAAEPTNVRAQGDLSVSLAKVGDALEGQGKYEPALVKYEASLAIIEPLAVDDRADKPGLQRDLFKTQESIGNIHLKRGELDAAQRSFEAAFAIAESLAAAAPTNALAQSELSVQHDHLGDVLEAQDQMDAALAEYREALAVRTSLAAVDLTNAQAQRDLSLSHQRVGDVLRKQARWGEALVELQDSLVIAQRLVDQEPADRAAQKELAIAHRYVADVLDGEGRSNEAIAAYEAALRVVEGLARAEPSDIETQVNLLDRYSDLGLLQERDGRPAEAQRSYCEAKTVALALADLHPDSEEWRNRSVWVEQRLQAMQDGEPAPC